MRYFCCKIDLHKRIIYMYRVGLEITANYLEEMKRSDSVAVKKSMNKTTISIYYGN